MTFGTQHRQEESLCQTYICYVMSASNATPALSTVKKVCYPQKLSHQLSDTEPQQIKWGKENEDRATEWYTSQSKLQHRELKVEKCGFIIDH